MAAEFKGKKAATKEALKALPEFKYTPKNQKKG